MTRTELLDAEWERPADLSKDRMGSKTYLVPSLGFLACIQRLELTMTPSILRGVWFEASITCNHDDNAGTIGVADTLFLPSREASQFLCCLYVCNSVIEII